MNQKNNKKKRKLYFRRNYGGMGINANVILDKDIHTEEKVEIKILNKEKLIENSLEDNLANDIKGWDIHISILLEKLLLFYIIYKMIFLRLNYIKKSLW